MSLLLIGRTRCPVCGLVIQEGQPAVSFPAFIWNQADPLLMFNDASLHQRCFEDHALREQVGSAITEMNAKSGPGHRRCVACTTEIKDPDDYVFIPRLSAESSERLARYNYTYLHRSHLQEWTDLDELLQQLRALDASGSWKGDGLRFLITQLESAAGGRR